MACVDVGEDWNTIPQNAWSVISSNLEQETKKYNDKNSNNKRVLIRKFRYVISDNKWSIGGRSGCVEAKNLFFTYVIQSGKKDENYVADNYIAIQFDNHGEAPKMTSSNKSNNNINTNVNINNTYHADHVREKMLRSGLVVYRSDDGNGNGRRSKKNVYHVIGCSNSQVKDFSFLFRKSQSLDHNVSFLKSIVPTMEELQRKKGVAKRVKYVGLLFSGIRTFVHLPPDVIVREISSIENNNYDFTDGPGLISVKLATIIAKQMNLPSTPSVFQIRYGGQVTPLDDHHQKKLYLCKGVLLVDPTETNKHILSFRGSMLKVELNGRSDWQKIMGDRLGIVDFSKRTIGKLNQQSLCLLTASLPDQQLLDIQKVQLTAIEQCWKHPFWLAYLAATYNNITHSSDQKHHRNLWKNFHYLIQHIITQNDIINNDEIPSIQMPSTYRQLCLQRKNLYNDSGKLQIPLSRSRLLFGAVFPEQLHGLLKEGQCLVFTERGLLANTDVIVSRSPSYSAGDIRVLEAIDLPKHLHSLRQQLKNCILFSTQGNRPETDKMGGGDMDGDLYLVIWDKRLLTYSEKIRTHQPADYDDTPPSSSSDVIMKSKTVIDCEKEDWITFMARFDNSMLGVIDSAFYKVVKEKGILSNEAKTLNSIFSGLVDKNPQSLDKLEQIKGSMYLAHNSTPAIWDIMLNKQILCLNSIRKHNFPSDKDFAQFMDQLNCSKLAYTMKSNAWLDLFTSNLDETSELSTFFLSIKTDPSTSIQHYDTDGNNMSKNEADITMSKDDVDRLNVRFKELLSHWKRTKNNVFSKWLDECRRKRIKTEQLIEAEEQKKSRRMEMLKRTKDEYVSLIEKERSEMNGNFFTRLANFLIKTEQQQKIDLLEYKIEMILFKEEDCIEGITRKEIEFEVQLEESELSKLQLQAKDLDSRIKTKDKERDNATKVITDLLEKLAKSKMTLNKLTNMNSKVKNYLEYIDDKAFFQFNMLSESSFLTIKKIVSDIDTLNVFKKSLLSSHLNATRSNPSPYRNEDKEQLVSFYEAVDALQTKLEEGQLLEKTKKQLASKYSMQIKKWSTTERMLENNIVKREEIKKEIMALKKKKKKKKTKGKKKTPITEEEQLKLEKDMKLRSDRMKDLNNNQQKTFSEIAKLDKMKEKFDAEKISLATKISNFDKLCSKLDDTINKCMYGELTHTIPTSIFIKFKDLIDGCESSVKVKEKILSMYNKTDMKHLSDPQLFSIFNETVEEINQYCENLLLKEKENLEKLIWMEKENQSTLLILKRELSVNVERKAELDYEISILSKEVNDKMKKMHDLFCPKKLKELHSELLDTNFEDSIQAGIDHVYYAIRNVYTQWMAALKNNGISENMLKKRLKKFDDDILRVCKVEENRIAGTLRNGERSGRLPVYTKRGELKHHLSENDVVIIIAGTGCGKSTQIPQYLADDFFSYSRDYSIQHKETRGFARICCSQPRRLAAQGIADRVSNEYITDIGNMVGFRVGKRDGGTIQESQKVSKNTRIEFVTEGWLLYSLTRTQKLLRNYDCIVIDEAHERNLETDLLLCLLKRYLSEEKEHKLKVVVMSATIDPKIFSDYFNGCPIIDCPGKLFPVEEFFKPDKDSNIVLQAIDVLFEINKNYGTEDNFEPGDCLIFLSGSSQINMCVDQINSRSRMMDISHLVAYPLYSQVSESDKIKATNPTHRCGLNNECDGKHKHSRKIICCTNIAETSLTIDGIRFVIESGIAKKMSYDPQIRCKVLKQESISKASSKQRRGRAGRTAPGRCFYLYSENFKENMIDYETPMIMHTPVERLILYSLVIGNVSIEHLGLLQCPGKSEIASAKCRLEDLGFIQMNEDDESIKLTEDGQVAYDLSKSFDPQSVRMILSSQEQGLICYNKAMKLGAILSYEEDVFFQETADDDETLVENQYHHLGDHFYILRYLEEFEKISTSKSKKKIRQWCKQRYLIYYAMHLMLASIKQCYTYFKRNNLLMKDSEDSNGSEIEKQILGAFISGYFSQVCQCIQPSMPLKMGFLSIDSGTKIQIDRDSCLKKLLSDECSDDEVDYISDSDDELDDVSTSEDSSGKDSQNSQTEEANNNGVMTITFIVYGKLFVIHQRGLTFAKSATLINDGMIIENHAPQSWLDRVQYDPTKKSVCKYTIDKLGRIFLRNIDRELKSREEKDEFKESRNNFSFLVRWGKNALILYGSEEALHSEVCQIEKSINKQKGDLIENDQVCDWSQKRTFQCGLKFTKLSNQKKIKIEKFEGSVKFTKLNNQKLIKIEYFEGFGRPSVDGFWRVDKNKNLKLITVFLNNGDIQIFRQILESIFPIKCCKVYGRKMEIQLMMNNSKRNSSKNDTLLTSHIEDIARNKLGKGLCMCLMQNIVEFITKVREGLTQYICDQDLNQCYDFDAVENLMTRKRDRQIKPSNKENIEIKQIHYNNIIETIISYLNKKDREKMDDFLVKDFCSKITKMIGGVRHKMIQKIQNNKNQHQKIELISMYLRIEKCLSFSLPLCVCVEEFPSGWKPSFIEEWFQLWERIGEEWTNRNPFWKRFCQNLSEKFSTKICKVVVTFACSRARFEIFCVKCVTREAVKSSIFEQLKYLCRTEHTFHPKFHEPIPRWRLWAIISSIDAIKMKFNKILFRVSYITSLDPSSHEDCVENKRKSKDLIVGGFTNTKTDFEKIDWIANEVGKCIGLTITMYNSGDNLGSAKEDIAACMPPEEQEGEEPNTIIKKRKNRLSSVCCMCRRHVLEVKYEKKKKDKPSKPGNYKNDASLYGWRLTLCGCVFCRNCFLNASVSCLKSHRLVKCRRCASPVLANDIRRIIWKPEPTAVTSVTAEQCKEDWNYLSSLSEHQACHELSNVANKKCLVCPDCMTPVIPPNGKKIKFVNCRKETCGNQFCIRCGHEVNSNIDLGRCTRQECKKMCTTQND